MTLLEVTSMIALKLTALAFTPSVEQPCPCRRPASTDSAGVTKRSRLKRLPHCAAAMMQVPLLSAPPDGREKPIMFENEVRAKPNVVYDHSQT